MVYRIGEHFSNHRSYICVLYNLMYIFLFYLFFYISVTLICVPMAVGQALYRVWVYGDAMCKLTSYLQG